MTKIRLRMKRKIMLMNMVIFIPVMLFVCAVVFNELYSNMIKNSTDYLLKESYNTQLYMEKYLEKHGEMSPEKRFAEASPLMVTYLSGKVNFRIQLYDPAGNLLADSIKNDLSMYAEDIAKASEGKKAYCLKKTQEHTYIFFSSPIYIGQQQAGTVRYLYPLEREEQMMDRMFLIMAGVFAFAVFLSWILSRILAEKIAGPLRLLEFVSEKNAHGDYSHEIHIQSGDEVEELAETFNKMTENIRIYTTSLQEEKQKQKQFFDHVTHEFKTPLTAIIGYAGLIPRLRSKEQVADSLGYIKTEGERLLKLVEELLELSRMGKSDFKIVAETVDLAELLAEAICILQPRLDKYEISLQQEVFSVALEIDRDKTKQVLLNILDNAIKYSECTALDISLEASAKEVRLCLHDDGVGMEDAQLEKLFDPLQRLGRKNLRQGNGFGLCICKEIMEKQGGSIEIYSSCQKGTTVMLIFRRGNETYEKQ